MKTMKIHLKGVELEIDGKKVVLPIDVAKDLHQQLQDLLGPRDVIYVPIPFPAVVPPTLDPCPTITWGEGTGAPLPPPLITICSSFGN